MITEYSAAEVVPGWWEFSGYVGDEEPGGLTIQFGGEPQSLQGVSVVTEEDGYFYLFKQLQTNGSDNGQSNVRTTDALGLDSNVAVYTINPSG